MTTTDLCPFVSIVVPTYQRRATVCDMLRTIGELNYSGKFEIIVAVDGSSDGTAEALRKLEFGFPLRVVEQANAGAAAARNLGARQASGEILLFLDDDMMCEPSLLAEHARCYGEGADAVIGAIAHDASSPCGFLADGIEAWTEAAREEVADSWELTPFDVFSGQLSVRAEVFRTLGGFDETFTADGAFSNEDVDFGVRLLKAHKLCFNPRAITRQRYVVTPRDHMTRSFRMGRGDARFAERYPELTADLLAQRGGVKRITRLLYRPLGRLPVLPKVIAEVAVLTANLVLRTRWRRSRTFARLYYSAHKLAYWSAVEAAAGDALRSKVLVLCYHSIADRSADPVIAPFSVPPDTFHAHLKSLARRGYTFIGPGGLVALLDRAVPLRRKSVLLTFDDCYQDLARTVRDELAPTEIPALAFSVTALSSNEWDQHEGAAPLDLLTAGELRDLAGHGLETGSHSRTHRDLTELPRGTVVEEVVRSADDLVRQGLPRPRFFAYPYGSSDRTSREVARSAGYNAAFGTDARTADRLADRFNLPRVMILASDHGWRFRFKTAAPELYAWLACKTGGARRA